MLRHQRHKLRSWFLWQGSQPHFGAKAPGGAFLHLTASHPKSEKSDGHAVEPPHIGVDRQDASYMWKFRAGNEPNLNIQGDRHRRREGTHSPSRFDECRITRVLDGDAYRLAIPKRNEYRGVGSCLACMAFSSASRAALAPLIEVVPLAGAWFPLRCTGGVRWRRVAPRFEVDVVRTHGPGGGGCVGPLPSDRPMIEPGSGPNLRRHTSNIRTTSYISRRTF